MNASVASEESPESSVSGIERPRGPSPRWGGVVSEPLTGGAARRKPVLQTPVSPGQAAGRYPLLVLLPLILIAVAGVTLGLERPTVYTATSQVAVREPIAPNAAELPGVITAAQQLAANDARLIVSPNVVGPLAPLFGVPSSVLAGRLSATPIPNATVISISATGPDAASAVRLANDASKNFASYLTQSLQSTGAEAAVLTRYQAAERALASAQNAESAISRNNLGGSRNAALAQAVAAVDAAQIKVTAIGSNYSNLVQADGSAPSVQPYLSADSASSNAHRQLEIYGLGGVIVGLVIGLALATLFANARAARRD